MIIDFNERVYAVTGAARGIGAGAFDLLDSKGAYVIGVDMRPYNGSQLEGILGRKSKSPFRYIQADVSDRDTIFRELESMGNLGHLDGLVHCAGLIGPDNMHGGVNEESIKRMNAGHVDGLRVMVELCVPYMNESGSIVVIGSPATRGPLPNGFVMYANAKRNEIELALRYSEELRGINVNIVEPNVVRTEGLKEIESMYGWFARGVQAMETQTPGGFPSVDRVANAILEQLSAESSGTTKFVN